MPRRFRNRSNHSDPFLRFGSKDSIAIKALKIAANLRKLINVEKKFIDTQNNGFTQNTTANIGGLTLTAQGSATNTRDGNSIKSMGLKVHYAVKLHSSAAFSIVRVIIFKDCSSNGALPAAADLMQDTTILSHYNTDNNARFRILSDKFINLTDSGANQQNITRDFINVEQHIKYLGTGDTPSDASTGHVYIFTQSDQGTNLPTIRYAMRYNYVDN